MRSMKLRRLAYRTVLGFGIVCLIVSCSGSMILLSDGAENVEKITVKEKTAPGRTVEITDREEIETICSWFGVVRLSPPPKRTFLETWNSMGTKSSCSDRTWYSVTIHPEPKLIGDDEPYSFAVGRTKICDDDVEHDPRYVAMDGKIGSLDTKTPAEYFASLFAD